MKMKLKGKFLIPTIAVIVVGMGVSALVSYMYFTDAIHKTTVEQLEKVADFTDQSISDWIIERQRQVANLSKTTEYIKAVQDGFVAEVARKSANTTLDAIIEDYPLYEGFHLVDKEGSVVSSSSDEAIGLSVKDRDYFPEAMAGRSQFSEVVASKTTGHPVFVLADPIEDKKEVKGVFLGVVDLSKFTENYIDGIKIGSTGYAYLFTDDGTVVAYPDKSQVGKLKIDEYDFGKEMMSLGNGVMQYELDGVEKVVVFRKNEETGWTVAVTAGTREIFSTARKIGYISLGLTLLVVAAVGVILLLLTQRLVTRPIGKAVKIADAVAGGDLTQRLNITSKDEVGDLAQSLDAMADSLRAKTDIAAAIAEGDLAREVELASKKDALGQALQHMTVSLNQIIGQIDQASSLVSTGADQVSDSSHALSQGATEQAASLEEITSTMTELGSQTQTNAENATQAHQLAISARTAAEGGNEHMRNMTTAMTEINNSSKEIAKLNKTIDDIAFQTNLLALNAAVEAARAGKHGKGFAVVAQEVRNLAGRSAAAANETADLIRQSGEKVENGAEILNKTADALNSVVEEIIKVADLIGEIAAASNEQAQGIAQVNQGLSQVEQVTQQNTATAEETASTTEELSSQAMKLSRLVSSFQLKDKKSKSVDSPQTKRASAPKQLTQKQAAAPSGKKDSWPQDSQTQMVKPQDMIALDDEDFGKY